MSGYTYRERAIAAGAVLFDHGIPSNFHVAPFERDGRTFQTVEHYFQAEKVVLCSVGTRPTYEAIANARSPREAKELGRLVPLAMEEVTRWDCETALVVMLRGCLAKFVQNEECRRWLIDTKHRPLVEHRPDPIWGDGLDGRGRNQLGKTLELVRARIR